MTAATNKKSPMAPVVYGDKCRGFVFNRGRDGFEAYDIDEHSLGVFTDERAAVAALFEHKPIGGTS
jgi:hypothetical protein